MSNSWDDFRNPRPNPTVSSMTQTDKAAEAKPEVELRVTWAKQDREFWLHMRLPDGKSAGINLGDPDGMIASAALRACVGHTFSTHPQDAESLRAEVVRLTAERDEWRGHVASANHERDAAQSDAREAAQIPSLMAVIDRLTADLATSRAETAMAFEVAEKVAQNDDEGPDLHNWLANRIKTIRAKTPADATAALAARDKATREKALRDAAAIAKQNWEHWLCAAGFEGFATGAKIISDAILSLIQEENQ